MTLLSGFSRRGWLFPTVEVNPQRAFGKSGAEQPTASATRFSRLIGTTEEAGGKTLFQTVFGKGPTSVGPLSRPDWLALQRLW